MSVISHLREASNSHIKPRVLGLNLLLAVVWGWLFRPIFPYLQTIFTRQDFRTNQIAIALLLAIFVYKAIGEQFKPDFQRQPTVRSLPLAICIIGTLSFVVTERFLDINTIGSALFVFSTYGLLGLYLDPQTWRNGLPVALLIAGTIPINNHLQTFVGYPMRVASAAIIRDALAATGIGSFGVNTILVFENGVAHVDIPCSGAQSLWTGAMFLTTATWLEQKRLGLRWLLTASLLAVLLFAANLMRIGLLVLSGQVMGWTTLAEMLHVPLGVLGFVGACVAALWLLRRWVPSVRKEVLTPSTGSGQAPSPSPVMGSGADKILLPRAVCSPPEAARRFLSGVFRCVRTEKPHKNVPEAPQARRRNLKYGTLSALKLLGEWAGVRGFFLPFLIVSLFALSLFHQPYVRASELETVLDWQFPAATQVSSQPLDPYQIEWLLNDGADAADRWRFQHGSLSGSMLFVVASNWHAHHFPEGCFAGSGLDTQESRTVLVSADFPVRWLTMTAPDGSLYTAVYWFQSPATITDDYATRIWDDLRFQRNEWVLVSALFDGTAEFHSAETQQFLQDLRLTVADSEK